MDETPEELEQIRREADQIDVHHYKKRFRLMKAIALGALAAGAVELTYVMVVSRRNPCERVRDHFCKREPAGIQCKTYGGILDESLHDDNPAMRANIKGQCVSKIEHLKEDDGIDVK
jgi:hypothetical protein